MIFVMAVGVTTKFLCDVKGMSGLLNVLHYTH